jgi:hypothetical protein
VYTYIIYIALSCRRILYTEVAHTNYFTGSLNIYIGKTPVPNSGTLFSHSSVDRKLYYSSGLSLNKA